MAISITNKKYSGFALLEATGGGVCDVLRPHSFPSETIDIPVATRIHLVRVPILESSEGGSLISTERARESFPISEVIGKNLESYLVESFHDGEGGKVNGVKLEIGVPVEDLGIVFVAT